jgi:hypothetical protein
VKTAGFLLAIKPIGERMMTELQAIREAWHEAFFLNNLELFEFLKHRSFSSEIEGDVLNKQEHKKNVELLIA